MLRAVHAFTVCLLMLASSGAMPLAVFYASAPSRDRCGQTCARCTCKRLPLGGDHLRGPCPCCDAQQEVLPTTFLPPAVPPATRPSTYTPERGRPLPAESPRVPAFEPGVPDPPPRTSLLV